ncbi:MAG: hypothetical protein JWP89_4509 [Schlesneria sp.]|nr:hypothetical protein [Schlesneria sp.]
MVFATISQRIHTPFSCGLSCYVVCLLLSGCVTAPYHYGAHGRYYESQQLADITEAQIERGRPRRFIDGVGWVVGIPDKILLWNRRIENHNVSPETEQAIADYLTKNELTTVKVRLNQYAPRQDWKRLVANKSVGWGWKYTLGTGSWLGETLLPGRLIGGDHFNPFTNTLHIYSDVPAVAIHEGGHAKDFARRYYKGTYAAGYLLPIAPLWYEAVATNDAVSYLRAEGTVEDEQAADRLLYPAYGTYLGDSVSTFVPGLGTPLYLGGVLAGHIAGRVQARRIAKHHAESAIQQAGYEESPTTEFESVR